MENCIFIIGILVVALPACVQSDEDATTFPHLKCPLGSHGTIKCTHLQLTSVPTYLSANVEVLDLSHNNITKLNNKSFENYKHLHILNIGNNNVTLIESGSFEHLTELKILELDENKITTLPSFLFARNHHLWNINLAHNKLTKIPSSAFQLAKNLTYIDLKSNLIRKLDFEGFSRKIYVEVLDLSGNNFSLLQKKDFESLQNCSVNKLVLGSNNITVLPPRVFAYLSISGLLALDKIHVKEFDVESVFGNSSIYHLSITGSKISTIIPLNNKSHGDTSSLQILGMRENRIQTIPDSSFVGLVNLRILDLQSNKLKSVTNSSFCGLKSLSILNLSRNKIPYLPYAICDCLPLLTMISLSHNEVHIIDPATFSGCSSLVYIDFFESGITDIKLNKWNTTSLERIELNFNYISRIAGHTFSGLSSLKVLNVSGNSDLREVAPNAFSETYNLEVLKLSNVHCLTLDGTLSQMSKLQELVLSYTKLEIASVYQFTNTSSLRTLTLSYSHLFSEDLIDNKTSASLFSGLTSLRTLTLKGNTLTDLYKYPSVFTPLTKVTFLDMTDTHIDILKQGIFSPLVSLKTLMLRWSGINVIAGDTFLHLNNLQGLFLQHNRIESIDKDLLKGTPNLRNLSLYKNQILTILPHTFIPKQIKQLDITENPLICDCQLSWFRNWLQLTTANLGALNEIQCSQSPFQELINQPVWSFHPEQVCGINIGLITGVSLASITVIAIGGLLYYHRWWVSYKIFLLKLAVLGYEEISEDFSPDHYQYQLNIMFHDADSQWVNRILKPALEERMPHVEHIIYGDEDLNLSMFLVNAIYDAMENSYKTVLLLSNHCIDDSWFMTKLRMALEHINDTKLDKVILVFLEDIGDANLPYLVRLFLSKNKPYLLWTDDEDGQELFWAQFEKSMRVNRVINNAIPV